MSAITVVVTFVCLAGGAIALWIVGSLRFTSGVERPKYSVLEERRGYEIREYEPISVESIVADELGKAKSSVSLLQGLANIQTALREVISGAEVSISINDDSVEHIFTMVNFISEKPKSARVDHLISEAFV